MSAPLNKPSKTVIDLYYDVFSPYSWIAFEALHRYEHEWNIDLQLKPFTIKDVMIATRNRPPASVMAKSLYLLQDLMRNNKYWGMNLQPPLKFTQWLKNKNTSTELAMKTLIAIQEEQPELLVKVSTKFWQRMWVEGEAIFSETDVKQVLQESGVTKIDYFIDKAQEDSIGEKLKKNTDAAIDLGAFGAPWIVVHKDNDSHCFFGSDRFQFIGQLLGERYLGPLPQYSKL